MEHKRRYSHYELRRARKQAGLTIDNVKDALKLKSKSRISEWENGKRYPTTRQLYYLAVLYKTLEGQLLYDLRQEAVRDIGTWLQMHDAKQSEKLKNIKPRPP